MCLALARRSRGASAVVACGGRAIGLHNWPVASFWGESMIPRSLAMIVRAGSESANVGACSPAPTRLHATDASRTTTSTWFWISSREVALTECDGIRRHHAFRLARSAPAIDVVVLVDARNDDRPWQKSGVSTAGMRDIGHATAGARCQRAPIRARRHSLPGRASGNRRPRCAR